MSAIDVGRTGHKSRRQQAGERLRYADTTPEALAATAVRLLGSEPTWPPIRHDGAKRAADLIDALLSGAQRGTTAPGRLAAGRATPAG